MNNLSDTNTGIEPLPEEEQIEELSIVEKIIGVYISPIATFKRLARRPDFWSAFIIVSLIWIAIQMVMLPTSMPLIESNTITQMQKSFAEQGLPEKDQTEAIGIIAKSMRILSYVGTVVGPPIGLAIGFLMMSGLIFLVSLGQGLDTDFKRLLGVMPWLSLISIFSEVAKTVVGMIRGITTFEQLTDMRYLKPFSLAGLIPQSVELSPGTAAVVQVLGLIDPFFIWSTIVMVFALQAANRCTRSQAIVTTIVSTLIVIIIIAILIFGGMALQGLAGKS